MVALTTLKMELESCSEVLVHTCISHFLLSQRTWIFRLCSDNQISTFSVVQGAAEKWDDFQIAVLINLIECKKSKTLWNVSSTRFTVFNKTGSVRIT
jgi:hypothetical protein